MAWRLPHPKSLVSAAAALKRDRELLTATIAPSVVDRRGEFRLFHPGFDGVLSESGEILLNMSRSGLAIGVRHKAAFARGERYRVLLQEGDTRADVEGRVCWTRSIWHRETPGNGRTEYFQTAGLAIAGFASPDEEENWHTLRQLVQEGVTSLEMRLTPV